MVCFTRALVTHTHTPGVDRDPSVCCNQDGDERPESLPAEQVMLRPTLCLIVSLTVLAAAPASIIVMLQDERDELKLVSYARDKAEVQEHGKKVEEFAARLKKLKEKDIEALF